MAISLCGGSASTITMANEFNLFGENTYLTGFKRWNYDAIDDKLIEKKLIEKEEGFWDKICNGVSKAYNKVKDFANSIQGKVLAGITFVGVLAIGIAYGASVLVSGGGTLAFAPETLGLMAYLGGSAYVIGKGYSDTKNNTNSSMNEYMFEGSLGAFRGLITLASSGAAGSYFKQYTRTGDVDLEQVVEDSVTEGVIDAILYGAGIAISKGISKGKEAISKIKTPKNQTAGIADDVANAVDDVGDDIANKVDDTVKGSEGSINSVDDIFTAGKKAFDNFDINNAYVKPKHLSTTGGNGQKFIGASKAEAESILKDALSNGKIVSISDNGLTKAGNASYEIIIDAGKTVGTKGENLVKIVISSDGGMLSAYPIK